MIVSADFCLVDSGTQTSELRRPTEIPCHLICRAKSHLYGDLYLKVSHITQTLAILKLPQDILSRHLDHTFFQNKIGQIM